MTDTAPAWASPAWAFVLSHSRQIERYARKFFGQLRPQDFEDARSEYITRIVEQHPLLRLADARNPDSVISTWLGFQAMAIRTQSCRRWKKSVREGTATEKSERVLVTVSVPVGGFGAHDSQDTYIARKAARTSVETLYSMATPEQKNAMLTVLADCDGREVQRLCKSTKRRDDVLASLRLTAACVGVMA